MAKKRLPAEVRAYLRQQGAKGGKIGGPRSLDTMTPEARRVRAKTASEAAAKVRSAKAKARREPA